jgi:hypothetical protein
VPPRYLIGPRDRGELAAALPSGTREGDALPFDRHDLDAAGSWRGLCDRRAGGREPDLVFLHLAYQSIPAWLWSAPVPLVGLAADAQALWGWCRHALPLCERVLADGPTVERLRRAGITHARPANLFGLTQPFLDLPAAGKRDIDILFVGNTQPAVQRERLVWLGRLAKLRSRWNVVIATGVFGDDYRALLRRSRVVFNRSVRGECNLRTFEAASAGCLLFTETGNAEVASYLADRRECVCYTDGDLEQRLEHYLTHEDERKALADAAHARVAEFSFEALFRPVLAEVERDLPELRERVKDRPRLGGPRVCWPGRSRRCPPAAAPTPCCPPTSLPPARASPATAGCTTPWGWR